MTQRAYIEEAIRLHLLADAAERTDADLAPLINRLLQDQHRTLGNGMRTLMVRVGHEMLRLQYVMYCFMGFAGVPDGKVSTWHEDGWRYAVKEFRRKPPPEPGSTDSG